MTKKKKIFSFYNSKSGWVEEYEQVVNSNKHLKQTSIVYRKEGVMEERETNKQSLDIILTKHAAQSDLFAFVESRHTQVRTR